MKNERNRNKSGVQSDTDVLCAHGVSRRIVVVSANENPVYEKVIYVVRDDAAKNGVTAEEVLREAQTALHDELVEYGEPLEAIERDQSQDADHVSRILFALSGVALALSGGVLVYWFFAI